MTVLNHSGWENYGGYPFEYSTVWRVSKGDITAAASALAAAKPLTFPTKLSTLLTDLNKNAVDAPTTSLETEPYHKYIRA